MLMACRVNRVPKGIGVLADIDEVSLSPQFGQLAFEPINLGEHFVGELAALGRLDEPGADGCG